jgi:ribosomal protein S18 acetylase RimI-like enzyme
VFSDIKTIEGLWVHPKYRRLGISHVILKEIVETPMALFVHKDNAVAIRLYTKYGFEFWYQDEDEDYYWMKNFIDNEETGED